MQDGNWRELLRHCAARGAYKGAGANLLDSFFTPGTQEHVQIDADEAQVSLAALSMASCITVQHKLGCQSDHAARAVHVHDQAVTDRCSERSCMCTCRWYHHQAAVTVSHVT